MADEGFLSTIKSPAREIDPITVDSVEECLSRVRAVGLDGSRTLADGIRRALAEPHGITVVTVETVLTEGMDGREYTNESGEGKWLGWRRGE